MDTQLKSILLSALLSLVSALAAAPARAQTSESGGKGARAVIVLREADACQSRSLSVWGGHAVLNEGPDSTPVHQYQLHFSYSYQNLCTNESLRFEIQSFGSEPTNLVVRKRDGTADFSFSGNMTVTACHAEEGEPICEDRLVPVTFQTHAVQNGLFSETSSKSTVLENGVLGTYRIVEEERQADVTYDFVFDGEPTTFATSEATLAFIKLRTSTTTPTP
jgi:hypothetical protein